MPLDLVLLFSVSKLQINK